MKSHFRQFTGCFAVIVFLLASDQGIAAEKLVGVLLSKEISPYVYMVSGLENGLGNQTVHRFFLDDQGRPFTLGGGGGALTPEQFSALVAVGPEALIYLQSHITSVPLLFGMVLNPQNLFPDGLPALCGVALNLPIDKQFRALRQQLPGLKCLGVLFDPANNQSWFDEAQHVAAALNLTLVPLQVRHKAGRLELVGDFSQPDALMFIPDKSIISRAVIEYVIKQAVLKRIPVIGYNQFFLEVGAALAFVIDYGQVGKQVAVQVEAVLSGQPCAAIESPPFELRRNPEIWQALDLPRSKVSP